MVDIYPSPTGASAETEQVIRDVPIIKGMNSRVHPRYVPEGQAAEIINVDLDDPSAPRKRTGYKQSGAGSTGFPDSELRISSLAFFDSGSSNKLLVAMLAGIGVYYISHPDNISGWAESLVTKNPSGSITPVSLDLASDTPKAFQANNLLWLIGHGSKNLHVMLPDGTITDLGDGDDSPPKNIADGCWMLNRVWLISRDTLYWSKINPSDGDFSPAAAFDRREIPLDSAVAGSLEISPNASSVPIAVVPWQESNLIVFGTSETEQVIVEPSDPLLSARSVIDSEIGCGARDSIVMRGKHIFFLDQYGEFRSIVQTLSAADMRGSIEEPLSEPIRSELSLVSLGGKINDSHISKCFSLMREERIYVYYPRGDSVDVNACAVWNSSRECWEGIYLFAHKICKAVRTSFNSQHGEVYAANGSTDEPSTVVYKMFSGMSDDGEEIEFRIVTRANDFGIPENDKVPVWGSIEAFGTVGAEGRLAVKTNDNDSFQDVGRVIVASSTESSFPLLPDDFPLTAGDFPLIGAVPQVTFESFDIDDTYSGSPQQYDSSAPIYDRDGPLFDPGGVDSGPYIQIRITESSAGKSFILKRWMISCLINTMEKRRE